MSQLTRIRPFQYIHVLDNNTNTQRVEVGPQTFTKQDHEKIVKDPTAMIVVPPRHFARIQDPYIRKAPNSREPVTDKYGQAQVRHGDQEIRFSEEWSTPFFLYPGESLVGQVTELEIVGINEALRIKADRDFEDEKKQKRVAGDEWLFVGPGTYRPKVEETIIRHVQARIIKKGCGIKVQANKAFVDKTGKSRAAGETWIIREMGAYLLHVDEAFVQDVNPIKLKPTKAVQLRAIDNFTDSYGIERKAGEEWLITFDISETHLLGIYEEKVKEVHITTLSARQYCMILNPVGKDGKNQYGIRKLIKGECSFFLQPGESLERGILEATVLAADEGLLLKSNESFLDERIPNKPIERKPGDFWMVFGPCVFVPVVEVEVVERRKAIPLDKNEGIYVRSWSGLIRAQIGKTYILNYDEYLWEKELPAETETLIKSTKFSDDDTFSKSDVSMRQRDKTRVVSYRVPHNSAVQIYDYKARTSRVVCGPELVMLEPDEQFTVLSLSGKLPKRPNMIKTIAIRLGPDFMTDVIEVETGDHARLRLKMAYNWRFDIKEGDYSRIFVVRDFVGDACKAVASLVRAAAAASAFDVFHKNSAEIITKAVFGQKDGQIQEEFEFVANGLVITNIDVQSVEPVDESTRESLMKSVQLAIKITAEKQERAAKHLAQTTEQTARGQIEKQKILNAKDAESEIKQFTELQGLCKAIEQSGSAKADAKARVVAGEIKGYLEIKTAELNSQATTIKSESELADTTGTQDVEVLYKAGKDKLELEKAEQLAQIESDKFKNLVKAIGPNTIKAIAKAGPQTQAQLLSGLGLKGYLMTDGNSPINLFNAAKGMVGQ